MRYKLVCRAKSKKPNVLGQYKTEKDVLKALAIYTARQEQNRMMQQKYPGQGISDDFGDLKIIDSKENK